MKRVVPVVAMLLAALGVGSRAQDPAAETRKNCAREFETLHQATEKSALAVKAATQKKLPRDEVCRLIDALSTAEAEWIKYYEKNTARCEFPAQALGRLKDLYASTSANRKTLCAR